MKFPTFFTHIFSLTFLSGTIPDNLKVAPVYTPIFKTNENNEFKNTVKKESNITIVVKIK
jgi:hypothetical protein